MAKHTEHYGLTKPEANDFYDVEVGNTNLDVINELIKGNEEDIEDIAGPGRTTETVVGAYAEAQQAAGQVGSVDGKIGSTGDVGGSTTAGSVFAKMNAVLQKFVAAWTDGRAAKLDNLDAAVSSRAAASTALSNGVWTNARAGLMDRLDGTISSRASQISLDALQASANNISTAIAGVSGYHVITGVLANAYEPQVAQGWKDIVNVTGKGVFYTNSYRYSTGLNQLSFIIDGKTVFTGPIGAGNSVAEALRSLSNPSSGGISFNASFILRLEANGAGT
ncbi:MAG: hypothetical protein AAGU12_16700 [Clostridiales bacterium]